MLSPAFTVLRGLVFPPLCEGCGAAAPPARPDPVCPSCDARIRPAASPDGPPRFDAVYSAFSYEEPLRSVLHAYKFGRRRSIGGFLGNKLSAFAKRRLAGLSFDAVVAVPAGPGKSAERGFHPPKELVRAVSAALGVPDRSGWLRARPGRAQTSLTRDERRENIRGRFYFRADRGEADGRAVLLVDDVFTTGSTVAECARVLKDAGAASVTALCLARGERR